MQQIEGYIAANECLMISRIICLSILMSLAVTDIRYRAVPGSMLMVGSVLAVGYCVLFGRDHIWMSLGGLLVGAFFVMVSLVTREGLGYGDSWLICVLGVYLGMWNLLELLLAAWLGAAAVAVIALIMGKFRRKTALPMVPFITAGYLIMWASEMLL